MQTNKILAFARQNLFALLLGTGVMGFYFYYNLSGKECFTCKQTETIKPDQQTRSTGLRFRHK